MVKQNIKNINNTDNVNSVELSKEKLKNELGCAVGNLSHTLLLLNILDEWFKDFIPTNLNKTESFAYIYSNYENFCKSKYPSTNIISKNLFVYFFRYECNKQKFYFNRVRIKGTTKYQIYESHFLAKKPV